MHQAKSLTKYLAIAICVLGLAACKSKPKEGDAAAAGSGGDSTGQGAPAITNTPMEFDLKGSDSGKIDGLQTINFDLDKAALNADAKKKAQGNADWIKSHPGTAIQIEGHCDARGSVEYNLSLGERRAQTVKSYLVSLGVEGGRLSIISYGKEKPLAMGESEADYSRNRRANFVPLSK